MHRAATDIRLVANSGITYALRMFSTVPSSVDAPAAGPAPRACDMRPSATFTPTLHCSSSPPINGLSSSVTRSCVAPLSTSMLCLLDAVCALGCTSSSVSIWSPTYIPSVYCCAGLHLSIGAVVRTSSVGHADISVSISWPAGLAISILTSLSISITWSAGLTSFSAISIMTSLLSVLSIISLTELAIELAVSMM